MQGGFRTSTIRSETATAVSSTPSSAAGSSWPQGDPGDLPSADQDPNRWAWPITEERKQRNRHEARSASKRALRAAAREPVVTIEDTDGEELLELVVDRILGDPGPFDETIVFQCHDDALEYLVVVDAGPASDIAAALLERSVTIRVTELAVLAKAELETFTAV